MHMPSDIKLYKWADSLKGFSSWCPKRNLQLHLLAWFPLLYDYPESFCSMTIYYNLVFWVCWLLACNSLILCLSETRFILKFPVCSEGIKSATQATINAGNIIMLWFSFLGVYSIYGFEGSGGTIIVSSVSFCVSSLWFLWDLSLWSL